MWEQLPEESQGAKTDTPQAEVRGYGDGSQVPAVGMAETKGVTMHEIGAGLTHG